MAPDPTPDLTTHTFRDSGRPRIYPWDVWADGTKRLLRRGVDYTCTTPAFKVQVYDFAHRNNLIAKTNLEDGGEAVIVQFFSRPSRPRR